MNSPLHRLVCCIFALVMLVSASLQAQIVIVEGNAKPTGTPQADYFFDTLAHRVWVKRNSNWMQSFDSNVTRVVECNGAVLLQTDHSLRLVSKSWRPLVSATAFECLDDITILHYEKTIQIIYVDSTFKARNWFQISPELQGKVMLGGKPAYCHTVFDFKGSFWFGEAVHGWGMFGTNGQWLIPPIFDAPFVFKNGVAEVYYYGQKFKINEQGERLK